MMAAMLEMSSVSNPVSTPNPRKRKKRAPAVGATADCFKCSERQLTCDRRRPYCSRCLDDGQDCSGYKTQLTWGVGVASRGKLRGLSLPIAGTSKAAPGDSPPKAKKRRDTIVQSPQILQQTVKIENEPTFKVPKLSAATPRAMKVEESRVPQQKAPMSDNIWDPTFFSAPHNAYDERMSSTHASAPQYNAAENTQRSSPYNTSHPQFQFGGSPWSLDTRQTSLLGGPMDPVSPDVSSLSTAPSYFERESFARTGMISPTQLTYPTTPQLELHYNDSRPYDGISLLLEAGESMQMPKDSVYKEVDEEIKREIPDESAIWDDLSALSTTRPFDFALPPPVLSGISNIGKTARMQYLINYYAEVISPVIVAFDSPTNPFRTRILRLAESSETLQHAISALAASNLRQRQGIGLLSTGKTAPARRSSFAHVHLTNEYAQSLLSPEEQMREEILHKRLAVSQLNQQLGHPVLRKGDAILATLLILCLFHICDSGVAKFQTQFAGVRKLLALRGDDMKIGNEDSRWMSRLFTWFDALAATVNDRERQITGQFLDMSALCGDWALENLAGVDGQLFKSISKLGRLNMLHRGQKVEEYDTFTPVQICTPITPTTFDTYASLDGNGWMPQTNSNGPGIQDLADTDPTKQFWREWNNVRNELLSWSMDTTLFDTVSTESSNLTIDQRKDMENISQSFRYSALLYLERLAHPSLPSSDETIQRWVRQSLHHIKQVISDVYLLWPLFITGTECIDEEGRSIIRGRCADIQKDSGFVNNASCLQLLEKIWRANSPHSSPASEFGMRSSPSTSRSPEHAAGGSAFMFRDVMVREAARTEGDGEYIVV